MVNSITRLFTYGFLLGCIYLTNVDAEKCAEAEELCKGHFGSCCPGAECYFFVDKKTKITYGKCIQVQPNYPPSYYEEGRKKYASLPDFVGPVDPAASGAGGEEYDDDEYDEEEEEYEEDEEAQPLQPAQPLPQALVPQPQPSQLKSFPPQPLPQYQSFPQPQPLPQYPSYPQPQPLPQYPSFPQPQPPPQQWRPFAQRQPSAMEQPRWQPQFQQMQTQQPGLQGY